MTITLAKRIQQVKPSATLAVAAKAAALRAEGKDIISLSTGEPDFDTPKHIKQAAIEAIEQGFTKYTAVDGIAELKQAIIAKLQRDNQLGYLAEQILVTSGAKQALFNLTQALLNPGDEVVIPAPYWVSYPDMVRLSEAKPIIISSDFDQNYKITADQLNSAITDKTRLFFINSPSNPSGQAYTRDELIQLAEVLKQHPNIVIATDDIYEYISWGEHAFSNIAMVCPELIDRIVVINGVSKAYAMTGWRIGYAAGPKDLIAAMKKIQSQSTSNPNSIAQKAAVAALNGSQQAVQEMVEAFKRRHDMLYQALSNIPDIKVQAADGTFYLFLDVSTVIEKQKLQDDVQFAERLLEKTGIALVPGTAFGCPGCIRLSFAASEELLGQALERLIGFV